MGVGRIARVGVFGSCCIALVAVSFGCTKFREQWPSRRLAREYTPPATRPIVMAPAVDRTAFASPQLEGLPGGVQAAFVRQHRAAEIRKVETLASGTGPLLYRISYVEDGTAGMATYTSGGADTTPPSAVVYRQDDSGRPKAKYAPRPEGGVPPRGTPSGSVD